MASITGSSPRTWGTGSGRKSALRQGRFIPTHVGNRSTPMPCGSAQPVHPHARGEQGRQCDIADGVVRFIPTHVGNSRRPSAQNTSRPVHPHARGEQMKRMTQRSNLHGSSPRTWGTEVRLLQLAVCHRFIPTHVGNSGNTGFNLSPQKVHPHARGEQEKSLSARPPAAGSSPRTWGTAYGTRTWSSLLRFIPTHVGNRYRQRRAGNHAPVHPHARGEQTKSNILNLLD